MKQNIESIVLFQIDKTSKISKIYSQREFDRLGLGITVEQWILLKIIEESNQLSQRELATKSLRDPASITRTIDILEKRNYVMRNSIPNNRRRYNLALTKVGQQFVTEHIEIIKEHRKRSVQGFTKQELTQLSAFLSRIQENME